ncbi:hypothetical protein AVL62_15125 [Serinicoccus chungangensis]|uniref:Polysaccharide chain length determinant N-terminal domain-containing protein n=2 Tax=Serinicoccus chungangensis TaxID=767452 RepID=A0A0W8IB01_9MICO|nr:hypothetical protein AVL62_15125 [Serinicoccus chungangensis]
MSILINPLEGNAFSPLGRGDELINMRTEAELVRSMAVAEIANDSLTNTLEPEEVFEGLSVSTPENTQLLDLEYVSDSEEEAVERVSVIGQAFLEYRRVRAQSQADAQTSSVKQQIEQRLEEREEASVELRDLEPGSVDAGSLSDQVASLTAQIDLLRARLIDLETVPQDPGEVVTPATADAPPPIPIAVLFGLIGLTGATVTALGLALLSVRAAGRIHQPDDLGPIGIQLLGEIEAENRVTDYASLAAYKPSESARRLRNRLLSMTDSRSFSLLLSSPTGESCEDNTALALAQAFAAAEIPTVLIDVTSALPSDPDAQGATVEGISDILDGAMSRDALSTFATRHLQVIGAGNEGPGSQDSYLAPAMVELLRQYRADGKVVIFRSFEVHDVSTVGLASLVDYFVLQIHEGITTRRTVTSCVAECQTFPSRFLGVVYIHGESLDQQSRPPIKPRHLRRKPGEPPLAGPTDSDASLR